MWAVRSEQVKTLHTSLHSLSFCVAPASLQMLLILPVLKVPRLDHCNRSGRVVRFGLQNYTLYQP